MECHRCEHQADVKAGKFRGLPFEKTPCGRCELRDWSGYVLPFDEERGADPADGTVGRVAESQPAPTLVAEMITVDVPFPEECTGDDMMLPMSVMSEVVLRLLAMAPVARDVVCWRFVGLSYRKIARMLGMTTAAVELKHKRALQEWPALRVVFSEKVTKQVRRKPHSTGGGAKTGSFVADSGGSAGSDGVSRQFERIAETS